MSKSEGNGYTPEFRAEAVKLVIEQGLSIGEAAQRLSLSKGTLDNWVAQARKGAGPDAVPGAQSAAEMAAEIKRLRKELAEVRMERDVIKKAAAYFARESLPGARS